MDFSNIPMFDQSIETIHDVLPAIFLFFCNICRCASALLKYIQNRDIAGVQVKIAHCMIVYTLVTKFRGFRFNIVITY